MDKLKYYDLDNILDHCSSGRIDMHEPIEVMNQSQTIRNEMTVLNHFVILSKSDKLSLIHILSKLRCLLKDKLQTLISNNVFIRNYVDNVIQEWKLSIDSSQILNDGLSSCNYVNGDMFNYDNLVKEIENSKKGSSKLKMIEDALKQRQDQHKPMTSEYAEEMKNTLNQLNTECNECNERVKDYSIDTMTKYKAMDPHHLQVLIDLSCKPKSAYLEFSNQFKESNNTFAVFVNETNDIEIPDTIHTMFLNYLITLNMIKKEMNYINNSLKQIVVFMSPKIDTLNKLVSSFTNMTLEPVDTIHDKMDGDGLQDSMIITDPGDGSVVDTIKEKIDSFSFF